MRIVVMVLGCAGIFILSTSTAAVAQNTFKTWKTPLAVCGVRHVGPDVRRFVATEANNSLSYDFAPSEENWRFYGCARDPNAPERVPTLAELLAGLDEKPDCAKQAATWAKMSLAQRREVARLNARTSGSEATECGLTP